MPTTSVVTPWRILLSASGFRGRVKSEWVWMSMKPGTTICPEASISRCASRPSHSPTAVMRPFLIATSAHRAGVPFPSITCPPRINRSSTRCSSMSGPMSREFAASCEPANSSWARRSLRQGPIRTSHRPTAWGYFTAEPPRPPRSQCPLRSCGWGAFRTKMAPSFRSSRKSATYPLVPLLVGGSGPPLQPSSGAKNRR